MNRNQPTIFPELNEVLYELMTSVQAILGNNFLAMYLQGSFAMNAGDIHSDADFLVVIESELSEAQLSALQTMHARIYNLDAHWAKHLEGSYIPKKILKQGPTKTKLFYLDNGSRQLIQSTHDNDLVVRWVTRKHGISLAGPEAKTLINPISAEALQQEVTNTMHAWASDILTGRYQIDNQWAQSFAVISYCRMLHTLETGKIESKLAGIQWAKSSLAPQWQGLIQQAWDERPYPAQKADPHKVEQTIKFIAYAVETSQNGTQKYDTIYFNK